MWRMWLIEKTGLRSLRCLRWCSPAERVPGQSVLTLDKGSRKGGPRTVRSSEPWAESTQSEPAFTTERVDVHVHMRWYSAGETASTHLVNQVASSNMS